MALTDNLVAYWKLDEASGNAADSVGSNTLTNNNTLTYSAGLINNGATFSAGGTMYLSIANASENPTLDITGAFTLQAWVKKNGNPATGCTIMTNGDENAFADEGYLIEILSNGKIRTIIGNGSVQKTAVSTGTVTNNAWHHIVVIYIPSTSIKIYIDGSEDGSNTTGIYAAINDPNLPFQIGDNFYDGVHHYFGTTTAGQIDECGVWNRAITTTEVTSLYNGGAGLQYPYMALTDNLVAYWKLDETSGNRSDSTANGHTLVDHNSVLYDAGKISNAALFVAVNDEYLDVADSADWAFGSGDFSVSLWVWFDVAGLNTKEILGQWVTSGNQRSWLFGFTSNTLNFDYSTDGVNNGTYATANWTPSTSTWYYITAVRSGNDLKLYVNASQVGSTKDVTGVSFKDSTGSLMMGSYDTGGGTIDFDGRIDECGIWKRALSSGELTALYNSGNGFTYPFSTTAIKTINGLAKSSVKTVNGLAIASVKSINGLA